MIAEIIAVGEEVLSGDVINSNAAFISRQLAAIGIETRYHNVVGDYEQDIIQQFDVAMKRADVICFSGGLGPTTDDLTKEAVAKGLGRSMYRDEEIVEDIKSFLKNYGVQITEKNLKQAMVIEKGKALDNPNGTAPGMYIEENDCHIFLLPGSPRELHPMVIQEVLPILKGKNRVHIVSATHKLVNISESDAMLRIEDIVANKRELTVAPYAKLREVHIKTTSIHDSKEEAKKLVQKATKRIFESLGEYVYSSDEKNLIDVVIQKLKDTSSTVGLAESCTGGMLASDFVDINGASDVFEGSIVAYSNKVKEKVLGISSETLEKYGAVSEETAREMAESVRSILNTDYGVSITGIAGPNGGTKEKPVGLVYIGIATEKETVVFKNQFHGNRDIVRNQSAKSALIRLYEKI